MLTDLQNSFTGTLSGKFPANQYVNVPPTPKHVATLPCEIFLLKNHNDSELSETNFRARLSHCHSYATGAETY